MREKRIKYYDSGKTFFEVNFNDNDKKDGLSTSWYENGQKMSEGNYKNGELNGRFTEWYKNGQKKYEGNLKDGKLEGLWTEWWENGEIVS